MSGESLIYFNGQFWVGLFTEERDGHLVRVGTYIFGAEPTAAQIDAWVAQGSPGLLMRNVVSQDSNTSSLVRRPLNPKRQLREARRMQKTLPQEGKAQQAMREVIELNKVERCARVSKKNAEQKAQDYLAKKLKKKAKLRGH